MLTDQATTRSWKRKGMTGKKRLEHMWLTALEPCSIRAMAILILCQRKMKRQMMTRKRIPATEVKAIQVSFCFRKSSPMSGVQFS